MVLHLQHTRKAKRQNEFPIFVKKQSFSKLWFCLNINTKEKQDENQENNFFIQIQSLNVSRCEFLKYIIQL